MGSIVQMLVHILIISPILKVLATEPFRRFEYKYSFKPPYLAQKDGSVPFWEHSGSKCELNAFFSAGHVLSVYTECFSFM